MQKYKLIYIGGYGRSGSTIMDILLSQEKNIIGLGELNNLFTSGWTNNEYCACGERALDCPFWNKVKLKWEAESDLSLPDYLALHKRFIRFGALPIILFNKYFPSKKFIQFTNSTQQLYDAISYVSGSRILVDSSKLPTRLLALKAMHIDVDILHLVRDGRKIMKSLKRPLKKNLGGGVQNDIKPRSTFHTATRWFVFNFLTRLFRGKSRYAFVKYEDLVSERAPDCIECISKAFNLNLEEVSKTVNENRILTKGHTIAGSRLRMKSDIKLEKQPSIKASENKNGKDEILFEILTFPLLKKYKYI